MALKYMYITNNTIVACAAEKNSVDRIWVDMEYIGKEKRQANLNTVKSNHLPEDISKIRNVISKAQLMVRVNPLYDGSRQEINDVISRGADIVMLPMFRTKDDVNRFIDLVNNRVRTMLLLETMEAENNLTEILQLSAGIDEIHIGLNDLHLAYKKSFMFELLAEGKVDSICSQIKAAGIPYGFGGVAGLNQGALSGKYVLAEHYRLGSSMAILSRSFYNYLSNQSTEEVENAFKDGMQELRKYENELNKKDEEFFTENHRLVIAKVNDIVLAINKKVEYDNNEIKL